MLKEGWLFKRGDFLNKAYKKRYFRLHDTVLGYYKSASQVAVLGTIDLKKAVLVDDPSRVDHPNGFNLIVEKRSYVLKAGTPVEARGWVESINEVLRLIQRKPRGNKELEQENGLLRATNEQLSRKIFAMENDVLKLKAELKQANARNESLCAELNQVKGQLANASASAPITAPISAPISAPSISAPVAVSPTAPVVGARSESKVYGQYPPAGDIAISESPAEQDPIEAATSALQKKEEALARAKEEVKEARRKQQEATKELQEARRARSKARANKSKANTALSLGGFDLGMSMGQRRAVGMISDTAFEQREQEAKDELTRCKDELHALNAAEYRLRQEVRSAEQNVRKVEKAQKLKKTPNKLQKVRSPPSKDSAGGLIDLTGPGADGAIFEVQQSEKDLIAAEQCLQDKKSELQDARRRLTEARNRLRDARKERSAVRKDIAKGQQFARAFEFDMGSRAQQALGKAAIDEACIQNEENAKREVDKANEAVKCATKEMSEAQKSVQVNRSRLSKAKIRLAKEKRDAEKRIAKEKREAKMRAIKEKKEAKI